VDQDFIERVLGKTVEYSTDASGNLPVPNCVAAALRAGGYLPVFANNGTDFFFDQIAPSCFDVISDTPRKGDLGAVVFSDGDFHTLAHLTLFMDEDKVFEKPSPEPKDKFQYSSWSAIKDRLPRERFTFHILRFNKGKRCALSEFHSYFKSLPSNHILRRIAEEIDWRLKLNDWREPSKEISRKDVLRELEKNRMGMESWAGTLEGGFNADRDLGRLVRYLSSEDLMTLILGIPALNSDSEREKHLRSN
jgi:hypothetical protein